MGPLNQKGLEHSTRLSPLQSLSHGRSRGAEGEGGGTGDPALGRPRDRQPLPLSQVSGRPVRAADYAINSTCSNQPSNHHLLSTSCFWRGRFCAKLLTHSIWVNSYKSTDRNYEYPKFTGQRLVTDWRWKGSSACAREDACMAASVPRAACSTASERQGGSLRWQRPGWSE